MPQMQSSILEGDGDFKTEVENSLDLQLERIVDDIKFLRLRLITTRSYIEMLEKQLNEAKELEEKLEVQLSRQLANEVRMRSKFKNVVSQGTDEDDQSGLSPVLKSRDEQSASGVNSVGDTPTVKKQLKRESSRRIASRGQTLNEYSGLANIPFGDELDSTGTISGHSEEPRGTIVVAPAHEDFVDEPLSLCAVQKATSNSCVGQHRCQMCRSCFASNKALLRHIKRSCSRWPELEFNCVNVTWHDKSINGAASVEEDNQLKSSTLVPSTKMYRCPACQIFCSARKSTVMGHIRSRICQSKLYSEQECMEGDQRSIVTDEAGSTIETMADDVSENEDNAMDDLAFDQNLDENDDTSESSKLPIPTSDLQCPHCRVNFQHTSSCRRHLLLGRCKVKQSVRSKKPVNFRKFDDQAPTHRAAAVTDADVASKPPVKVSKQPEFPYQCQNCQLRYQSSNGLRRHLIIPGRCKGPQLGHVLEQKPSKSDGTQVPMANQAIGSCCFICGKPDVTEWSKYSSVRLPVCLECEARFYDCSLGSSDYDPAERFVCVKCNRSNKTVLRMAYHLRRHTGYKPFICYKCGHASVEFSRLKGHIAAMHEELLTSGFQCEICMKIYGTRDRLKNHKIMHNEKKYVCSVCGKAFPASHHLKIHMRYHTGERRYACKLCPKAFVMSCHLTKHMFTHSDEKSAQCPICSKYFKANGALTKHMKQTHLKLRH